MPNTREKLIELVGQVQDCGCDVTDVVAMNYVENNILVDHLIANGVTVQKWTPVTERLPKPCDREPEWSETVLFRTITGRLYSGYRNQGRLPTSFYDDDWYPPYWMDESEQIEVVDEYVTHWMPLPEPPKGETPNG